MSVVRFTRSVRYKFVFKLIHCIGCLMDWWIAGEMRRFPEHIMNSWREHFIFKSVVCLVGIELTNVLLQNEFRVWWGPSNQALCFLRQPQSRSLDRHTLKSFLMLISLSMVSESICFLLRSNMHFFEELNQRKVTVIRRRITDFSPGQRNVTNWNLIFSEFNRSFFLFLLGD